MLRKGLIACLAALLLCAAALAEEIPYFSDLTGELPVSEERAEEGIVLQTYTEVSTSDCAVFSARLLESGFTLTDKTLTDTGAVRMTFTKGDARVLTEIEDQTLRVTCPDLRKDPLALSRVGDVVVFGTYASEPLSWIVLEDEGNCLLFVTEKVIETMSYHETCEDITWKRCSLRKWIGAVFLEEAFTAQEREKLMPDASNDRASLLTARQGTLAGSASPTEHALSNGCNVWENGCSWYYLQDAGYTAKSAACVRQDGKVFYEDVNCSDMGVRIAILYRKGIK